MQQLLFFDGESMHIYDCSLIKAEYQEPTSLDVTSLENERRRIIEIPSFTGTAMFYAKEVKAELDPTTMLRIAKYNQSMELEKLTNELKAVKERIADAKRELKIGERKLEFIGEMNKRIWEDDEFSEDKYFCKEDSEDYEWQ